MIADLLRTELPAEIAVLDAADIELSSTSGPLVIINGGAGAPIAHSVAGVGRMRRTVWQLVCVSNTRAGAALIASLVSAALDGTRVGGSLLRTQFVSGPIEDRDDPSEWRWSVTVEATHY